ncbi:hypothetical protein D1872_249390 [compost metagenome]
MLRLLSLASVDRLLQIIQDVVDRLCTYRQANQAWCYTGSFLCFCSKLLMCRAGRMNNQRFGIADIGKMGEQLHVFDQFTTGFDSTLDLKSQDRALTFWQVLLRKLVGFMTRKTSIAYPFYLVMSFKKLGYFQCILTMTFYAQMKRLKTLKQKPCVKW